MSIELTKEKYLEMKKQGLTDGHVNSKYHIAKATLYRLKREWGIPLRRGGDQRSKKPPVAEANIPAQAAAVEPASKADPQVVYVTSTQEMELIKQLQDQVERLLTENGLLKDLVKIYL